MQNASEAGVETAQSAPSGRQDPPERVSDSFQERAVVAPHPGPVKEIGGPEGPEPTRYGDWEKKGRCIDF